jgi:type VI secretion system secreted protein VgrG
MPPTQDNRRFTVSSPLGKDALLLQQLSGSERISSLFEFNYALLSASANLSADKILGQGLTLTDTLPGGGKRYLHGVVAEFAQIGYGDADKMYVYRAVVRPWLWFLTRTADCRIFEKKSVPDIFEAVVKAYGFSDYNLAKLKGTYEPLEYCVQYRETDFNFVSRLLEHEGIYYYFEHHDGRHVLVLADDSGAHQSFPGYDAVTFLAEGYALGVRPKDHLAEWSVVHRVDPVTFATTDFDFTAPGNSLLANATIARQYAHASFEVFDYPAPLDKFSAGDSNRLAKLRIEELQATQLLASGQGDAAGLSPGCKFKLKEHPSADLNIEYLVLGAHYVLSAQKFRTGAGTAIGAAGAAGAGAGGEGERYQVAIEAIDARTPYRPPRLTPKPVVHGAQTAIVVGANSGDEIYTDEYGRIKVKFHWIRPGAAGAPDSSCMVRVSQLWAGDQFGAMHIPRVGQEVIVDFLEGDPDRPIVTGRVYNATNMPPYTLPDNATQSGIKSRSSKGGTTATANELRFEDKKGSEQVLLHAEKDLLIEVENNGTMTVTKDQQTTISGNLTTKVSKDETRTLEGNRSTTVSKDDNNTVTQNYLVKADKITLQAGSASIVIKSSGEVTITGDKITLSGTSKIEGSAMQVSFSGTTQLDLSSNGQTNLKGMKTTVQGTMLQLSGDAMAKLGGGITMIG